MPTLRAKISVDTGNAKRELALLRNKFRNLEQGLQKVKTTAKKTGTEFVNMRHKTHGLQRSFGTLRNNILVARYALGALGFYATGRFVQQAILSASQVEKWALSFEVMTGSVMKGTFALKELALFEKTTTLQLPDIIENAKQLKAMGIELESIVPTMKTLGDVAFGLSVPLSRLALNFGQVRSQGKLTGRELRDFAMAGVPLVDELSKNLRISKDEIGKMVSAGKIGFKDVENAFRTMTSEGGTFADIMSKGTKTFAGQVSLYQTEVFKLKAAIGRELIPTAIQGIKILKKLFSLDDITPEIAKQQLEFLEEYRSLGNEARLEKLQQMSEEMKQYQQDKNIQIAISKAAQEQINQIIKFGGEQQTRERLLQEKSVADAKIEMAENNIATLNALFALTAWVQPKKESTEAFTTSITMMTDVMEEEQKKRKAISDEEFKIWKENWEKQEQIAKKISESEANIAKEKLDKINEQIRANMETQKAIYDEGIGTMTDSLVAVFDGSFDKIGDMWISLIKRMVAEWVASGIMKFMVNLITSGSGSFGNIIGNIAGATTPVPVGVQASIGGGNTSFPTPIPIAPVSIAATEGATLDDVIIALGNLHVVSDIEFARRSQRGNMQRVQ